MNILISAAESSSDAHGAELLKAIQEQALSRGIALNAFGIGGPKLRAAGLNVVIDARQLMVMGFSEILFHLPRIFLAMRKLVKSAQELRPDLVVLIDYPEFHFILARFLSPLKIPLIYYIPPKVWAWRKGRVHFLKKYFTKILSILPFEESFYQTHHVPVKYVGNPLVDELPLNLTKGDARQCLSLKVSDRVIVIMPGSRSSELKEHVELMLRTAYLTARALRESPSLSSYLSVEDRLVVLVPLSVTTHFDLLNQKIQDASKRYKDWIDVRVSQGNSHECLVAADAGMIKSGTSTLEAALLKCPHAVVYKPSKTSEWIFKYLIRYTGPVGLVNLVAGWSPQEDYLISEFLCDRAIDSLLKDELVDLLTREDKIQRVMTGLNRVREKILGRSEFQHPSRCAATEVMQIFECVQDSVK